MTHAQRARACTHSQTSVRWKQVIGRCVVKDSLPALHDAAAWHGRAGPTYTTVWKRTRAHTYTHTHIDGAVWLQRAVEGLTSFSQGTIFQPSTKQRRLWPGCGLRKCCVYECARESGQPYAFKPIRTNHGQPGTYASDQKSRPRGCWISRKFFCSDGSN